MAKNNDCWGIEVGANAIKAMRLVKNGGEVTVADYAVHHFKKILSTPDLNVDEQIQLGLDQFQAAHELTRSTVCVSVPGNLAFARFAKLPPVDPKKIPDIVKFEAAQQIPFPIEQVEWDYHVFSQEDSPDVEVGIFAITREKVTDFLEDYHQTGLTIDALSLSPLAVYNAMSYDLQLNDDSGGVVMLDIGTTSTDVIIYDQGKLWTRTLPTGGNNFTEALVKAFKLSFPKAEKLKREAGTSKYARQIFTAMRPVFADLVQEVQRSLGYYQSLNRDCQLEKLIALGSTFRLPGLQKYFKQQLQMAVVRPDGFNRVSMGGKREADFANHTINLATAYGLALQGLGVGQIEANIMPAQQIRQRMWKAKQRWFIGSAATVALPAALLWANIITTSNSFEQQVKRTDSEISRVVSDGQRYQDEWVKIKQNKDPRQSIENVSRILDYRDVWPKLIEDLVNAAAALDPQPETIVADYSQIRQIPRAQRRRIYIESIEAKYKFQDDVLAHKSGRTGSRGRSKTSTSTARQKTTALDYKKLFSESPPQFEITVRGTTPMPDAITRLSDHFIKWLQDHSDQPNRPYRVKVPDKPLQLKSLEVDQMADNSRQRLGTTKGQRPQTGRLNIGRGMMMPPGMTGAVPGRGLMLGGMNRNATAGLSTDLTQLLPQRPLNDESKQGDWEFEVTWTIELTEPDEARKSETAERLGPKPGQQQAKPAKERRS